MNGNNNNGLNEFNKRNIELRNKRVQKRNIQKCAVLAVFVLLIAILSTIVWLVILDIMDNVGSNLPGDDPAVTTDGSESTTSPSDTTTDSSGTTDKPADTTPAVTTSPSFTTTTKNFTQAAVHWGDLILVNNDHPFVFPADMGEKVDYIKYSRPADSKSLYFRATDVLLLPKVSKKLYEMTDASLAATKINDLCLTMDGAYRTFDEQQKLFSQNTSAFPGGCSDFNTALAVYFIGWDDAGKTHELDAMGYQNGAVLAEWFETNSYKYGFIKRFSASKSNITGQAETVGMYRYVGYVHAYNMVKENLCLEEYLNAISKYTFDGEHYIVKADDGHRYEIYYVASTGDTTAVPVPDSLYYEISGDNIGGFIVTITLD